MMKIVENVPIHPKTVVACPKVSFKSRYAASACGNCEFFAGLGEMCADPAQPWDKRFAIRCTHVITRRTHILEIVD